jgi:hypothetical protein
MADGGLRAQVVDAVAESIESCAVPHPLRVAVDGRTASGKTTWMPDRDERASLLRQHLEQAGATRADLFADDERQKHITFHDLRATGITWMAVRGDDPLRIKQRAGHKGFATTEMYIREAENLAAGFGEPLPPLPPELLGPGAAASRSGAQVSGMVVEQRGIEPEKAHAMCRYRRSIAHLAIATPCRRVPIPH